MSKGKAANRQIVLHLKRAPRRRAALFLCATARRPAPRRCAAEFGVTWMVQSMNVSNLLFDLHSLITLNVYHYKAELNAACVQILAYFYVSYPFEKETHKIVSRAHRVEVFALRAPSAPHPVQKNFSHGLKVLISTFMKLRHYLN